MDFNLILSELNQASTFELFRLKAAIDNFLDDPARLAAIKRALHPGMEISYFDQRENRLIPARLQKIHKTRAEVEDLGSGKCWTIPLYMINVEAQTPRLHHSGMASTGYHCKLEIRWDSPVGMEKSCSVSSSNSTQNEPKSVQGTQSGPCLTPCCLPLSMGRWGLIS